MIGILAATAVWASAAAAPATIGAVYFPNSDPKLPFSSAVQVGDVLYLSGALASDDKGGVLAGGMPAETKAVMGQIGVTLKARGLSYDDVFKCTVMLTDMSQWGEFNKIYVTYFKPDRLPARSAFGAAALARGAHVELECWARVKP